MNDDAGTERARELLVAKRDRSIQEGRGVGGWRSQTHNAEDRPERLGGEQVLVGVRGIEVVDQRSRRLGVAAQHVRVGVGADGGELAVGCSGIVRAARRCVAQVVAQRVDERIGLRPVGGDHHDLRGDAVEARVVQALRGQVAGGRVDLVVGPLVVGHHDRRADAAELGGEGFVDEALASRTAAGGIVAGAEQNRVMRRLAARDVHGVDQRVMHEGLADVGTSRRDAHQVERDERRERLLERLGDAGVHRVELDDGRARLAVEGAQHVEGGNARHVARAEHGGHAGGAVRVAQRPGDAGARRVEVDAGPQPHVGAEAREHDIFRQVREGPDGDAPARRARNLDLVERSRPLLNQLEGLLDCARRGDERVRAARPLLAGGGGARVDVFDRARRRHPLGGDRERCAAHLAQQGALAGER